jgi:hypothetical protein
MNCQDMSKRILAKTGLNIRNCISGKVSGGELIILTCSWEQSWIGEDAAQPERIEVSPCQDSLWEETGEN